MKKINYLLIPMSLAFFSCRDTSQQAEKITRQDKKELSYVSREFSKFETMKEDKVFKNYMKFNEALRTNIASGKYRFDKFDNERYKQLVPSVKNLDDLVAAHETAGMSEARDYITTVMKKKYYAKQLFAKYPELKDLSPIEQGVLLREARGLTIKGLSEVYLKAYHDNKKNKKQ